MKHAVPHDLSPELARKATHKAWESYSQRLSEYDPQAEWINEDHAEISFKAKGIKLKGTFEIEPNRIVMNLDVPLLLRIFQKRAVDIIDREIKMWVERARAGELD